VSASFGDARGAYARGDAQKLLWGNEERRAKAREALAHIGKIVYGRAARAIEEGFRLRGQLKQLRNLPGVARRLQLVNPLPGNAAGGAKAQHVPDLIKFKRF